MSLSFKQIVAILMDVNGIHVDRQSAFEARLKQWQKMGFPSDVNVGKGTRASYGAKQAYQLAICLALLEIGMTPERAHETIRLGWQKFAEGIVETTECISRNEATGHYWFIKYDALTDLKDPQSRINDVVVFLVRSDHISFVVSDLDLSDHSVEERNAIEEVRWFFLEDMSRCVLLESEFLVTRIWFAMAELGIDVSIFSDEIKSWQRSVIEKSKQVFDETEVSPRHAAQRRALDLMKIRYEKYPLAEFAQSMIDADYTKSNNVDS